MTETMWKILGILIECHFDGRGYAAVWQIAHEININLAGCIVTDGDPALEALVKLGLIEEVPDLGCRYRIVVTDGTTVDAS